MHSEKIKKRWMDRWGYALLCALCAGVIIFSALWTREKDAGETKTPSLQNASGTLDETLSDVKYSDASASQNASFIRPCAGAVVRPFSAKAEWFPDAGLWRTHPGVDFSAQAGETIYAMEAGTVTSAEKGQVALSHGGQKTSVYKGLDEIICRVGQSLAAGDPVGTSGAAVPFEGGESHVCVSRTDENGAFYDFMEGRE